MKIDTKVLQEMINKSVKGIGNNKLIPITQLIGIEVLDSILYLYTTDGLNTLVVKEKIADSENFYTVVNADTFSKLVGKTTSKTITLQNEDNCLKFKGNGSYKLDLAVNEDSELIQFNYTTKYKDIFVSGGQIVEAKQLKYIINTCKVSIAKLMNIPCLTGYYLGEKCVSTDSQKMTVINKQLLDSPLLLSNTTAELISLFNDTNINIKSLNDKDLMLESENLIICTSVLEGIDIYPIKTLDNLIKTDFPYSCIINKQAMLNVLDRLNLFVSDYDSNAIKLIFSKDNLQVMNVNSNAVEDIEISGDNVEDYSITINIEMLKSIIQNVESDDINIMYGNENLINITNNDVINILCLMKENK